jgi:hypothetical protein
MNDFDKTVPNFFFCFKINIFYCVKTKNELLFRKLLLNLLILFFTCSQFWLFLE